MLIVTIIQWPELVPQKNVIFRALSVPFDLCWGFKLSNTYKKKCTQYGTHFHINLALPYQCLTPSHTPAINIQKLILPCCHHNFISIFAGIFFLMPRMTSRRAYCALHVNKTNIMWHILILWSSVNLITLAQLCAILNYGVWAGRIYKNFLFF